MENLNSINIRQKAIDDIYGEYNQAEFSVNDSINIFGTESYEDIVTDEYDSSDWEEVDIKTKKTGFLGLGGKQGYYKAPNGMELKFDLSDDVIIKRNKNTGEIFINNAQNLVVNGTDKDDNLTISGCEIKEIKTKNGDDTIKIINNSHMAIYLTDKFNTGKGNDTVLIKDSTIVEEIKTGDGNDKIIAQKSNLNEILTQNGNDSVKLNDVIALNLDLGKGLNRTEVNNSDIENLTGGKDNDIFFINNSHISDEIDTGSGDDSVIINNSEADVIETRSGQDSIYIQSSRINDVELGADNDMAVFDNSEISTVNADKGEDTVSIYNNSKLNILDSGKHKDILISDKTSVINKLKGDDKVQITDYSVNTNNIDDINISSIETAKDITDIIINKSGVKNLTEQEQYYALALDLFTNNLNNMKTQFQTQENNDGIVLDSYNAVKELMDLGVSKEDIKSAINEQEKMVTELKNALNGKSDKTFEQVFKKWTGVDFNKENYMEYMQYAQMYSLGADGLQRAQTFEKKVSEAKGMQELIDLYIGFYGEDEGIDKLNEDLKDTKAFQNVYTNSDDVYIHKKANHYEIIVFRYEFGEKVSDRYNVKNEPNLLSGYNLTYPEKEYTKKFEEKIGMPLETLAAKVATLELKTFGTGNAYQKLIDKYCAEQNGFLDKVKMTVKLGGMICIVGGSILMLAYPPAAGIGLECINIGQKTIFWGGIIGSNALKIFDELSSENTNQEEILQTVKSGITDLLLYYSGRAINGVASGVKEAVLSETHSKVLSLLAEMGTDTSLSLISDLILTGEIDYTGEGLEQLLSVISGIAGARVNSYYKEAFDNADYYLKNNDIDGAYDYLKSKGISDKQIYNSYKAIEEGKIFDYYRQTGDYDTVIRMIETSKVLSYDSTSAKQTLDDFILNAEQTKVRKMITDGADIDTVANYINNSPVLTEADLGYFEDIMPKLTEEVITKKLNNIDIAAESKIELAKNLDINRINEILNSDNPQKQAIDTVNKIENFRTKVSALLGDSADIDLITEFMFKNSTWVDSQAQFEITQTQLEKIQSTGATRENTYILAPQPNKELKSYTNAARDLIDISQSSQLKLNPNNTRCEIDLSKIPGEQHIIISDDCSVSGSSMIEDMINKLATTGEIDGTKTISIVPTVMGAQAEENISNFIRLFNQITESDMTKLVNSINANKNLSEDIFYQTVSSSLSGKSKEMFDILYKVTDKKIKTRLPELSQNLLSLVSAQNLNGRINFELIDGIKAANFQDSAYYNNLTETQQNEIYSLLSANGQSFGYNDSATDIIIEGYKGNYNFDPAELGEEAKEALGIGKTLPEKGNAPNNNTIIAQIFAEAIGIPLSRIKISGFTTPETYFELIKQDLTTVPQGAERPFSIKINTRNNDYNNSYTINGQKFKAGDTIVITYKDIFGNPCEPIEFTLPEIKGQEDPLIFFKNYWDSYNENSNNFKIVQGTSNADMPKKDNSKTSLVEGKLDQYLLAFDITVDGRTINIEKAN